MEQFYKMVQYWPEMCQIILVQPTACQQCRTGYWECSMHRCKIFAR